MALVRLLDFIGVRGRQAVQPMPLEMRAGNHPQRAVMSIGVDQVVHQKELETKG